MCIIEAMPAWKLDKHRVEVWRVKTQPHASELARLESTLSPDERARAACFRFDEDRDAFIAARGTLRFLLARYLLRPAGDIEFEYGRHGKPSCPQAAIQFNVSHTRGIALFAFTSGCNVGVDIELVHKIPNLLTLANQFFCPAESQQLAGVPEEERDIAFFLCWTRKEACLKANGDGLSMPPDSFCVSVTPGSPARILDVRGDFAQYS
jgi:4'-phosphopantetheinyl transferase